MTLIDSTSPIANTRDEIVALQTERAALSTQVESLLREVNALDSRRSEILTSLKEIKKQIEAMKISLTNPL